MSTEIQSLRAEVAALRGEVRRTRRRGRLLPLAIVALFVALIPGLAIAANPFNDLVGGSPHNGNIDLIYNAGITNGCVPNQSYCPTDLVTRQEMASFLARTAGLGANQPVVNAKTAVQANTANTATTAQNAQTLNGFAANGLVRTNLGGSGENALTLATDGSTQTLASVSLTLPGPGLVIVHGSTTFVTGTSGTQINEVFAAVGDRTAQQMSYPQFLFLGLAAGTVSEANVAPVWTFQVPAAGQRSFDLLVSRNPNSVGQAGAFNGAITATFVPFGPGGAVAADLPTSNGPFTWPATSERLPRP